MKKLLFFLLCFHLSFPGFSQAQDVEALGASQLTSPDEFTAIDKPNDNGGTVILAWKKMPYENENIFFVPVIAEEESGPFYRLDRISSLLQFKSDLPQSFGHSDNNKNYHAVEIKGFKRISAENPDEKAPAVSIEAGKTYYVGLKIEDQNGNELATTPIVSVVPRGNLFAFHKLNSFFVLVFLMTAILLFIYLAKRNPNLFIRKIAGLDAIDDALGRATEMGKEVLFAHGLKPISEVSTIAAINILGRIAKKVAEFDAGIKVANWDPIIQQVCQETVKEAYIEAGRPDAYREDNIYFASSEQFSYAAAIEGLMVREKPAANFFFGYFYAESLLLSETGANTGAIQIAGTDSFTQIPFFITTCDYTLIGEELYAASAYLSREPKLLGSLKGQDVGKVAILLILILGTLLASFGQNGFAQLFWLL